MKVYLEGKEPDPNEKRYSGSVGTKTAVLDMATIDRFDLREPLINLGRSIAEQFKDKITRDTKQTVIGVDITGIDFQLILSLEPKRED